MSDTSMYERAMEAVLPGFRKKVEPDWGRMREAQRFGAACKHLLDNEDLIKMLDAVERVYMNAWRGSDASDTQTRERCHIAVSVVSDFRNYLQAAVENGDAAAREWEKFQQR